MFSAPPEVIVIPFTTNLHAELVLASTVARLERGNWAANILKTQNAIVRIAKPADSPHKLQAASSPAGALTTSTTAATVTPWTTLADGSVESPLIEKTMKVKLELKLVATNGTEVARATPIVIITKGDKPDDETDPEAKTDPATKTDAVADTGANTGADAVANTGADAVANTDPQSEKAV